VFRLGVSIALVASLTVHRSAAAEPSCARCGWVRPTTARTIFVDSVSNLREAVRGSGPDTSILIADGDYEIAETLELRFPRVVLAGQRGHESRVFIHGRGMNDPRLAVAIGISASNVTIASLGIRDVASHGVQVRGERGASHTVLHDLDVRDTGQQLVKASRGSHPSGATHGLVACSRLGYTDTAPSDYTNAVDVLGGTDWHVRDNRIRNIRGPRIQGWRAGPAILFWAGSSGSVIERNLIADSFRGIALGLDPRRTGTGVDHHGGVVRENVIVNRNPWADEGIEINAAPSVRVEENVVDHRGTLPWSISLRFPSTTGVVRGNSVNRAITTRDGATVELVENRAWTTSTASPAPLPDRHR